MARPSLGGVPRLLAGLNACWSCSTPTIKALCGIDCSVRHLGSTCMAGLLSILFGAVQSEDDEDGLHTCTGTGIIWPLRSFFLDSDGNSMNILVVLVFPRFSADYSGPFLCCGAIAKVESHGISM